MRKIRQVHRRGAGILLPFSCLEAYLWSNRSPKRILRSAAERAMQSAPRQFAADMLKRLGPTGDSASMGSPSSWRRWRRHSDGPRTALPLLPAGPIGDSSFSRSCM